MNWNISAWCIRNPIPPIVLFLLLTAAGISALLNLGLESEPNIDLPAVSVYISQNGAAPSEIETQITRKVEDAVAGIANVKHVKSTVTTGSSSTDITFELGANSERATSDVRAAINNIRSQLPRGIDEPWVQRQDNTSDFGLTYIVTSSKRSNMELGSLLENTISRTFMAAPSIGQTYRFGGVNRQICVDLDPVRMEAFGVTADTLNTQLKAANTNLPGGRGNIGAAEESIRALGSMHTVEQLRHAHIVLPGKKWVELGALGEVTDGSSEQRNIFQANGKQAIGIELVRRRGKNIVQMEKDSERIVAEIEKKYPDLKFTCLYNAATYVKESCSATFEAMILGAVLAVIVIYLFLRNWRAALIAALAMPLSVIPTFAYMQASNFTLNDMSLLGLALVIGILVDDAIVEIENIVRHMNTGKKPFKAAIDAADEIGMAVVATTMAAVVVFLPVGFMGGISGLWFRQFGLTVAVAVFCSLLVARLITPVMAAYWLKPEKEAEHESKFNKSYESLLTLALKHRWITVILGALCFAGSVGLFKAMPTTLMSRTDNGKTGITVELPPGSRLSDTAEVVNELTAKILKRPEVESIYSVSGNGDINKAHIRITLKPRNERKLSLDDFEAALRPQLVKTPGAKVMFEGSEPNSRLPCSAADGTIDCGTNVAARASKQLKLNRLQLVADASILVFLLTSLISDGVVRGFIPVWLSIITITRVN